VVEPTTSNESVGPPPMFGRWVALRPIVPDDYRMLYEISIAADVSYRWRFHGAIPPYETFVQGIHAGIHAQFAVIAAEGGNQALGHVVCYRADLRNGTAYIAVVLTPRIQQTGAGIEAVSLFVNYLFATWNFRKLYLEAVEFTYRAYKSGEGRVFNVEGCLKDFHYYQRRFWDLYILTIDRQAAEPFLARFIPHSGSREAKLNGVPASPRVERATSP
jgi:RimJ/RimL family protein N-acetyltransferase